MLLQVAKMHRIVRYNFFYNCGRKVIICLKITNAEAYSWRRCDKKRRLKYRRRWSLKPKNAEAFFFYGRHSRFLCIARNRSVLISSLRGCLQKDVYTYRFDKNRMSTIHSIYKLDYWTCARLRTTKNFFGNWFEVRESGHGESVLCRTSRRL